MLVRPHIPCKSYKINNSILKLLRDSKITINSNEDIKYMSSSNLIYLYFKQMADFVNSHIDNNYRGFTPIFFMATAGIRMLEDEECRYYMKQISALLKYFFPQYPLHENLSVRVLQGVEEGIYSFVSVQELMYIQSKEINKGVIFDTAALDYNDFDDRLLHISGFNTDKLFKYATIIEIGGASVQIVSPLPKNMVNGDCANDSFYRAGSGILPVSQYMLDENIYKLNYDSNEIHLFSKSYMGLGKQLALLQYLHMIYNNRTNEYGEAACLPVGFRALLPDIISSELKIELDEIISEKYDSYGNMIPYIIGTGNYDMCNKQIDTLLDTLVGAKMPYTIQEHVSIIGMENIFYTLECLKPVDGFHFHEHTSVGILQELGRKLCPMNILGLESHFVDRTEREKLQTACFTINLIVKILNNILSLDENRIIYPKQTILGNDLTWTLGVSILDIPNFINTVFRDPR